MIYKQFQDIQLSRLGMGNMRLPVVNGDDNHVDTEKAVAVIRGAYERGINYFDTAWAYPNSEAALGKALAFFQANGLAVPEVLNVLFAAEAAVSVVMVGYVFIHYLHFFFMRIEEPKSAAVIRENKQTARFSEYFEN